MVYFGGKRLRSGFKHHPVTREQTQPPVVIIPGVGSTSGERKRQYLEGQFRRQNGLCWWCGELAVLLLLAPPKYRWNGNEATIEHLDSKLSGERGTKKGQRRRVMAHSKCNEERAKQETALLPAEVLVLRSTYRHLDEAQRYRAVTFAMIALLKQAKPAFLSVKQMVAKTGAEGCTVEGFLAYMLKDELVERIPAEPKVSAGDGPVMWRWKGDDQILGKDHRAHMYLVKRDTFA